MFSRGILTDSVGGRRILSERPVTGRAGAIEQLVGRWQGDSYVDYSFDVALQGALRLGVFDEIPEAIQQGFPSFKVFTLDILPPHPRRPSYRLDFGRIQLAMEGAA